MSDTNEEARLRAGLHRLAARAGSSNPPLEAIVSGQRRPPRNPRVLIALAAAAATALLVGVVSWVFPEGSPSASPGNTDPTSTPSGIPTVTTTPTPTASTPPAEPAFRAASDCPVFKPQQLPSGAPAGEARPYPEGQSTNYSVAYGSGRDLLVVNRGREAVEQAEGGLHDFPGKGWPGPVVGEIKRSVVWVGHPPSGTVQIRFLVDGCAYVVFLNPEGPSPEGGFTEEQVLAYAKVL